MARTFTILMAAMVMIAGWTQTVRAQTSPVVVELFTSQGCSSCPPADRLLGRLVARGDVIALSLHVDYWDYLGWRDIFGSPEHTRRQRGYAAKWKERSIYTPQMVVHGADGMVGSNDASVMAAISAHAARPAAALVQLHESGGQIEARISAGPAASGGGDVLLVWYSDAEAVTIAAGENRGKDITYHNVVRGWARLGDWRGDDLVISAAKPMSASGVVVIVQSKDMGPILGAAQLALN